MQDLGTRHHTDKMKPFLFHHGYGYLDEYERYTAGRRDGIRSVLEIGVKAGNSLPVWRDFYPNALVWGIDVNESCRRLDFGERVRVRIGHQEDEEFLRSLITEAGGGFDVVIDDGSHLVEHQLRSLAVLLPVVRPLGIYAIEDLSCSYMKDIGQGMVRGHWFYDYLGDDPDKIKNNRTDFDKALLAIIQAVDERTSDVRAVHLTSQLCVIEKG